MLRAAEERRLEIERFEQTWLAIERLNLDTIVTLQ
jgi:hypothetical protein